MPEQSILPILVASKSQNDAERLNGALRSLGMRVHSSWGGDAEALDKALADEPELLFLVIDDAPLGIEELGKLRDLRRPATPIIVLATKMDDFDPATMMTKGARDLINIKNVEHLKAVIERELPVARMSVQLQRYADALSEYEERLGELLSESQDAIAYVQDGIHMRVNPAYLKLFGYDNADALDGIPVMDVFDAHSQGALKKAIQQAVKQEKTTDDLELQGVDANGDTFSTTISLAPDVIDDEPCLRIAAHVAQSQLSPELEAQLGEREREAAALKESLADIRHRDPLTGVYHRAYFLDQLSGVKTSDKAVRALALVTADQFAAIESSVGAYASGRVITQLVELVNASVSEKEPVARFDDDTFAILLSRADLASVEKWAADLCEEVSKTVFEAGSGSTSMTCSVGITEIESLAESELLLSQALEAGEEANKKGGNCHVVYQPPEVDSSAGSSDAGWVKRLTEALRKDQFELAFYPIASLGDSEADLKDVLVRLHDTGGEVIPAGQFLPHAERLNLMPAIDKWIIRHLLPVLGRAARDKKDTRYIARVSNPFLTDDKMVSWLETTLNKTTNLPPKRLIFQFPESSLDKHLKETKAFIDILGRANCGFTIAQFGLGRNSVGVLDHLKPDYIKFSNALISNMDSDESKREMVAKIIEKAQAKKIDTVAQHVASADTIAMLWQMGVQYIEGAYDEEP